MDVAVENRVDGDEVSEDEKEGMKVKEIIGIAFIMGIWFYSLTAHNIINQQKHPPSYTLLHAELNNAEASCLHEKSENVVTWSIWLQSKRVKKEGPLNIIIYHKRYGSVQLSCNQVSEQLFL